jgi:hypothetical protein
VDGSGGQAFEAVGGVFISCRETRPSFTCYSASVTKISIRKDVDLRSEAEMQVERKGCVSVCVCVE